MKKIYLTAALCLLSLAPLPAQEPETVNPWKFRAGFNIQTDIHCTTAPGITQRFSGNTYIDATASCEYLDFGLRLEEMNHPFPGHEIEKGWGLPHFHIKGNYKGFAVTLGDVYEQFGSGMLLYLYEDRPLGIDNAIRGASMNISTLKGVNFKALVGQQRNHFDNKWHFFNMNRGFIWGGDLELMLGDWIPALPAHNALVNLGASFLSKYEKPSDIIKYQDGQFLRLNQPENVGAWASRIQLRYKDWDFYSEFAYKFNDPNANNAYTYRPGSSWMTTLSYARKGLSFLLGARRSDNFDFRSAREQTQNDLKINYLQPFTLQQTYTLAALYPYATQPQGEWALQGEIRYTIPRKSKLGGKYGTGLKLSASYISGLDPKGEVASSNDLLGTRGPSYHFWHFGEQYFHDVTVELSKRVTKGYKFTLSYINQGYNQKKIEGHAINGDIVNTHIVVYEGLYKLSKKVTLRNELQYMHTKQAEKDWIYALFELSVKPYLMFTISEQYNLGTTKQHYPMFAVTGLIKAHRLMLGIGRTRKGINCSGGVCRMMPETKGVFFSYNFSF